MEVKHCFLLVKDPADHRVPDGRTFPTSSSFTILIQAVL
jgi:hypothetical protein